MPWTVYNSDGQILQGSSTLADDAVTTAKILNANVTLAKMAANSIDSDQYVDASIDNAHLADDAVGVAELSATGTASSSTFLRGDNAWAAVAATAPVFGRATRTAANVTTTSTSLVDLTDASITFTTGAFPVAFAFGGHCAQTNANEDIYYNVIVDSTLQFGASGINMTHPTTGGPHNASFSGDTVALSAASHTLKVQWRVGAGTGTTYANSDNAWVFSAHEIR